MANLVTVAKSAHVYRDSETGRLYVKRKTQRRRDRFSGDDDIEGVEGEEELEGVEGEEELEGDEFGAKGDRLARKERRWDRGDGRRTARRDRVRSRLTDKEEETMWEGAAVIGDSTDLVAAGAATLKIRVQHDFLAEDVTFEGSLAGAKVTSIFFGDEHIWSNSAGVPVAVFGAGSFIRGFLKGRQIKAGLDVIVSGTLTGAGTFSATLTGKKPVK